jgi:hypothetical protein
MNRSAIEGSLAVNSPTLVFYRHAHEQMLDADASHALRLAAR